MSKFLALTEQVNASLHKIPDLDIESLQDGGLSYHAGFGQTVFMLVYRIKVNRLVETDAASTVPAQVVGQLLDKQVSVAGLPPAVEVCYQFQPDVQMPDTRGAGGGHGVIYVASAARQEHEGQEAWRTCLALKSEVKVNMAARKSSENCLNVLVFLVSVYPVYLH